MKSYPLAAALCFFLVCIVCGGSRTMAASGNGQGPGNFEGSVREEELEAQVREHYDAILEMYRSTGMEEIDVIDLIIYPCEEYRIIIVSYDVKIEGIETKVPGANTLLAKKTAEGSFILFLPEEGLEQEIPEDDEEMLHQKVTELMENQDIIDIFREVNQRYIDAKWDPDIREWEAEAKLVKQSRIMAIIEENGSSATFYVVKEGDCLWDIAGDMLGDSTKWDDIYEINKDVIGEDPNYIMPGMELQLP